MLTAGIFLLLWSAVCGLIGYIEGVDLCTEGVLTMKRVVEIAKRYASSSDAYSEWMAKRDGASLIAQMLFEDATDVNLFVGRAMNPAHQNPDMPIDLSIKLRLIDPAAAPQPSRDGRFP